MSRRLLPVILDLVLVLVFATIGRRSHAEGLTILGVLDTAWPFLLGACLGHVAVAVRRGASALPASLPTGLVVWVCGVGTGMVLRRLVGEGTDPAFVAVATLVLGGMLLGWRALVRGLLSRQRGPTGLDRTS